MFLSRLTIRWRITIGSVLIAILFFGAAAIAFSNQVSSILYSTTKTLLEHDAAPFVTQIRNGSDKVGMPGHAQLVEIIDSTGTVARSTLPPELSLKLVKSMPLADKPREVAAGDDTYLVLSAFIEGPNGRWHVISARNLEASQLLQSRITGTLVIGALVLLVGFGIASWLLTGAALRPVTRMRQRASELSKRESTAGLPVGPARDELSALAITLNEFIDAQRATTARERQLLSDASHELRSPIAVLMAQLELAHLSKGDAVALEAQISAAEESVRHISALATNLLELSDVESHHNVESGTWAELTVALGAAADRARLVGLRCGVTVDFDAIGTTQDALYQLDHWRFGRILDNLSGNAIAAMPRGGELCLRLQQHQSELELLVIDTGVGIPDDFLPVAFDRFTRPDDSRTHSTGGSGLGLAIVRAMVKAAGGDVALVNRDGSGACARVVIPSVVNPLAGTVSE